MKLQEMMHQLGVEKFCEELQEAAYRASEDTEDFENERVSRDWKTFADHVVTIREMCGFGAEEIFMLTLFRSPTLSQKKILKSRHWFYHRSSFAWVTFRRKKARVEQAFVSRLLDANVNSNSDRAPYPSFTTILGFEIDLINSIVENAEPQLTIVKKEEHEKHSG